VVRRPPVAPGQLRHMAELSTDQLLPLFPAVSRATEEAMYNSLCIATTMTGYCSYMRAFPLDAVFVLSGQGVIDDIVI
jgi:L-aminopeptidase/D-esterase-like protein